MKIKVKREDGAIEVLEFIGPLVVHEGEHLNYVYSNDGLEHYFTHEGFYDGWGTGCRGKTDQAVDKMVDDIEAMRRIEPGG